MIGGYRCIRYSTAISVVLSLVSVLSGAPLNAQNQYNSASGRVQTTIVQPIKVVSVSDLSFGAVEVDDVKGGEVIVSANDNVTYLNGVRSNCASGQSICNAQPAKFLVFGEPNRTYAIILEDYVVAIGSQTRRELRVDQLSAKSQNLPERENRGRLGLDGKDTFKVGGRLIVPSKTLPDIFRADVPITTHYE